MRESMNQSLAGYVFLLSLQYKYFLAILSAVFGLTLYLGSLLMPILYKSEATLMVAPSDTSGGLEMSNGLSALASLSGINLAGSGSRDEIVLEIAKSRSFVIAFIDKHGVKVKLEDGQDLSPLKRYKYFMERFSISKNKFTGLISISFLDVDKLGAKNTLDFFIKDLNAYVKSRDIENAKKSLEYLDIELKQSNQDAVKNMLYGLMEANYRKIALANSTDEYALTVVDSPYLPETKFSPQTLILVLTGVISGFILGLSIVHIKKAR